MGLSSGFHGPMEDSRSGGREELLLFTFRKKTEKLQMAPGAEVLASSALTEARRPSTPSYSALSHAHHQPRLSPRRGRPRGRRREAAGDLRRGRGLSRGGRSPREENWTEPSHSYEDGGQLAALLSSGLSARYCGSRLLLSAHA